MTSRDFCYWLQGYFEIESAGKDKDVLASGLGAEKVRKIKKHLAMVFKHEIDPSHGDEKHQKELDKIHNSGSSGAGNTVYRC